MFADGTSCICIFVLSLNIINQINPRKCITLITCHFILVMNLSIVVDRNPCSALHYHTLLNSQCSSLVSGITPHTESQGETSWKGKSRPESTCLSWFASLHNSKLNQNPFEILSLLPGEP